MEVKDFGAVIRVHDLNYCRIFYQRLLGLGEPEINSTFLIRFRLSAGATLSLEKSDAPYLEHASAATALFFTVKDLSAAEGFLKSGILAADPVKIPGSTGDLLRGEDPEGNVFYIGE